MTEMVVTAALASRMRYTQLAGTVARLRSLQATTPASAVARHDRLAASIDVLERERQAREALPRPSLGTSPQVRHAPSGARPQGEVTGHTTRRQAPGGTTEDTMATSTPSKAQQARELTGTQQGAALRELQSALLIGKGAGGRRFYWPKATYPTLAAASAALEAAGLKGTLDFTQYRAQGGFANLVEVIAEKTGTPAVELPAVAADDVAEVAYQASVEAAAEAVEAVEPVEPAEAAAEVEAETPKPAATRTPAATGPKLPKNIDRSVALVLAYLASTATKPGERKVEARKAPSVRRYSPTPRMVDHALWEAGLMPNQKVQPAKLISDHVQAAVASKLDTTWKKASKGAELGRNGGGK